MTIELSRNCPVCKSGDLTSFDDLQHCRRCDHLFQWPPTVDVSYDAAYLRHYDGYPCDGMSWLRVGFLKAFVGAGRLLDVGYGNGAFVRAALAAGFDAYGCDVHGADCGVREIDPLSDRTQWDVVTCFDSLEHFPDLSSIRDLMRRATRILVSVPLRPDWFPAERRWRHYKPGEHLHYFSRDSLARLIGHPLVACSDVEDAIRRSEHGSNIYTAVYGP